jgi:hypothetical protein
MLEVFLADAIGTSTSLVGTWGGIWVFLADFLVCPAGMISVVS